MLGVIDSFSRLGLECDPVNVEVDIKPGLPVITISGLASREVKEARERLRPAIENSGFDFPMGRITINLSPVETLKNGSHFDLAMGLGVLIGDGQLQQTTQKTAVFGEFSLSGEVRWIRGIIPLVSRANEDGYKTIIVPYANLNELSLFKNQQIIGVKNLREATLALNGQLYTKTEFYPVLKPVYESIPDFSEVSAQNELIRAFEVAAAGNHHMLIIGPPGTGKSMCGARLPGIMPPIDNKDIMEINKIYSTFRQTRFERHILSRPFRSPHNSASTRAMIGGGPYILPGEVSLAHKGILFLDEFLEFKSDTLQSLRTVIEKKEVFISLRNGSAVYPADFLLIAACNPCSCGYHGVEGQTCTCSAIDIKKYTRKLNNPLTDRIDIQIKTGRISYNNLTRNNRTISSATIRSKIETTRDIQTKRYKDETFKLNSAISPDKIKIYCEMSPDAEYLINDHSDKNVLTARSTHKIIRLARTIADIDNSQLIELKHITEAIQMRTLDGIKNR